MAGFFKKMAGAFVELDETHPDLDPVSPGELNAEAAALLASIEEGARSVPEPAPPPPPPPPTAPAGGPAVGAPFDDIYARAQVPRSPYTAEMLLRVVDGLRALPPAQAVAAITAMDSADDRWTVGDVLLDADRKMDALRAVGGQMEAQIAAADRLYQATSTALQEGLASTEEAISKQMAELEALRREARDTAATERAAALSEQEATRQACAAESDRLRVEVKRLQQVHEFLGESQGPVPGA